MNDVQSIIDATKRLYDNRPCLRAFFDWPQDLTIAALAKTSPPVAQLVKDWRAEGETLESQLHNAVSIASHQLHWKRTYSEAEVGAHFLNNYGYIELIGPHGHAHSETARLFICYWGPGLKYDWHNHEAEELYYVLSGQATLHAENEPSKTLHRGAFRTHTAFQPHALTTNEKATLMLIPWRGAGISDLPKMIEVAQNPK